MRWVVGVDLGGTAIKAAIVSEKGEKEEVTEIPTQAHLGRDYVLEERLLPLIKDLINRGRGKGMQIEGVGVAVASPLDPWDGVIYHPPNLPGWGVFPILSYLKKRLSLPVCIDNDANLFALGEWMWGAGKGETPLLCLTLGTGVGGGIIYQGGTIWHGAHGAGGELGHITIDMEGPLCNCGSRGCLEALASASALERWVREAQEKGRSTLLPTGAKAKEIAQAARQGDPVALEAFQWVGRNLGVGMAALANAFDPRVIVLGGGLSKAGMLLLSPAMSEFRRRALPLQREKVKVHLASLESMGGVLGAALLALGIGVENQTKKGEGGEG